MARQEIRCACCGSKVVRYATGGGPGLSRHAKKTGCPAAGVHDRLFSSRCVSCGVKV